MESEQTLDCEAVRVALPLPHQIGDERLDALGEPNLEALDLDPEELEGFEPLPGLAALRAHLRACASCRAYADAFEADGAALASIGGSASGRPLPAVMNGFADDVLAAIASERAFKVLPGGAAGDVPIDVAVGRAPRQPLAQPSTDLPVPTTTFRFGPGRWVAAAAVLAFAAGLGFVLSLPAGEPGEGGTQQPDLADSTRPVETPSATAPPTAPPTVSDSVPNEATLPSSEATLPAVDVVPVSLPAPPRVSEPMHLRPRRSGRSERGAVVPVDARERQRNVLRGHHLLEMLQRAFPSEQGGAWGLRGEDSLPSLPEGQREVRF